MIKKPILIVGGGISGITTAVEAAEVGYEVILVEKLPYIGGNVIKFHKYFPKLCPPYCGLEINFRRIKENPGISVYTSCEVKSIAGTKGNYSVELIKKPEYINSNCTACGECEKVCPVEIPDEFNSYMDKTKSIYLPHELAFPYKYNIDDNYCEKESCGKCLEVCKYYAIDLNAQPTNMMIKAGAIIFATGWESYNAMNISELRFGDHPDIITNVMMERIIAPNGPTKGKLVKPSDHKTPQKVAFVQCAGSRDENHLPYCSAVCCSASLKHALIIREKNPDAEVYIYYIDLRVTGRNEDFLNKVKEDKDIHLINGKIGKIEIENNELIIIAEDISVNKKIRSKVDMVVLATGIVPSGLNGINVETDQYGFITSHEYYGTGCAKRPIDVSASIKDATGMALKAIQEVK